MSAIHNGYQGVFDQRIRFGNKAALLVIDFIKAYADPASPFHAPAVVEAAHVLPRVLTVARRLACPVFWTRVEYSHPSARDGGIFVEKVPALKSLQRGAAHAQMMDHLQEHFDMGSDFEIIKQYPSAFFATSLASSLRSLDVDTLLIAGCTTSGCVRATAVDALQHGFRPFVIEDCVGDRSAEAHRVNLLDLQSKYAEVVGMDEAIELLMTWPAKESQ